jgi:hypothetical protein
MPVEELEVALLEGSLAFSTDWVPFFREIWEWLGVPNCVFGERASALVAVPVEVKVVRRYTDRLLIVTDPTSSCLSLSLCLATCPYSKILEYPCFEKEAFPRIFSLEVRTIVEAFHHRCRRMVLAEEVPHI